MPGAEPDYSAPEGASCAAHPEHLAHFTCPRCGDYVCALCWHPSVSRCDPCLQRDPIDAAPPIPWERDDVGFAERYFGTLATAFRPYASAPAFGREGVPAAVRFFLISALPMALYVGIIEHTRTLLFADAGVRVLDGAGGSAIAFDVVRAVLVQLVTVGIDVAALVVPFWSLVRAYGEPARRRAAVRVVLYRAWLLYAAGVVTLSLAWMVAVDPSDVGAGLRMFFQTMAIGSMVLLVLLAIGMRATARMTCGVGSLVSVGVTLIPFVLWLTLRMTAESAFAQLLPPPPELP